MSEQDLERIVRLLEEIRDDQKVQLERQAEVLQRQAEALDAQKARAAGVARLTGQADAAQVRADEVVARAARLVSGARLMVFAVVPVAIVLLVLVCWLAFGHPGR